MSTNYTAGQIANWFLARNNMAIADIDAEEISNMKLQKLLYYAQGTYMAITGSTLFGDPIVAWKHGPVVETIYHNFKEFGSGGISQDGCELPEFGHDVNGVLEQVYDVFGQYSAWKLRKMTHEESPWETTALGEIIDAAKIKEYFAENYIVE